MGFKDKAEGEFTGYLGGKYSLALIFSCLIIGSYFLLFREALNPTTIQDFTSLYAALLNLVNHANPYAQLITTFLPKAIKISPNLNPPFALLLFSPLAHFSYATALKIWIFTSFILGLLGAGIAFYYAVSADFLKKYWFFLCLSYLSLFATMANLSILQVGTILLFFIMLGYHFYLKNQNLYASLSWSLIISLKLFPALLLFFALRQRRLKLFLFMLLISFLALSLPYFLYGQLIYSQYIDLMSHVFWYGDNWNASIFGFVVRMLINFQELKSHLVRIDLIYASLLFISLLWYLKKLGPYVPNQINHQPFCLTLTMMLFMSPFGWLYYFPLLIFPLILTWIDTNKFENNSIKIMLIWLLTFILLNYPQPYTRNTKSTNFSTSLVVHSFYFYGLILLNYLCVMKNKVLTQEKVFFHQNSHGFILATFFTLFIAITVTVLKFSLNLFK